MEGSTSKNIIIALLIGIVLGLLAVILGIGEENDEYSDDEQEEMAEVEEEREPKTVSEIVEDAETPKVETKTTETPKAVISAPVAEPVVADKNLVVVTYTNSGFIPPVVEVRAGGSVSFVNSSNKPMWVTSENHPTAKGQVYRGFDQGKSVATGGIYSFPFTQVGVWGFKNLNFEEHLGAVSVIEQ